MTTIPAQCVQVGGTIIPAGHVAAVSPLYRSTDSPCVDWWTYTVDTIHGQSYSSRAKVMICDEPPAELVAEREAVLDAMESLACA